MVKYLSIALSGDSILVGTTDSTLLQFDKTLSNPLTLYTFTKSVRCITSGKSIMAAGSFDGTACLFIGGKFIDKIEGPESEIKSIAFNSEESKLALATRGKTVWVCNLIGNTVEIDCVLDDHTQDVKGCAFIGKYFYTWGYDCTIKVYKELKTYDSSFTLYSTIECESTVWDLIECGQYLICSTDDGFIKILDINTRAILREKKMSSSPILKLISINENTLAFIHNYHNIILCTVDFTVVKILEDTNIHITSMVFNGEYIYSVGECGNISTNKIT